MKRLAIVGVVVAILSGCATTQTTLRIETETKAPDYLPTVKVIAEIKT